MGCCQSAAADAVEPREAPKQQKPQAKAGSGFSNSKAKPVGDQAIQPGRRCVFGVIFPESTGARPCWMFFDKEKPVEKIIAAAAAHGGFSVDKGRMVGSPEKLNIFTYPDGDVVRLDLEIDAHLGSTLHEGRLIVLEKGNRLSAERLQAIGKLG